MPRVHININELDELDDLTAALTEQPVRRHGPQGQTGRRAPLSAEEARERGRKPRTARQIARRQPDLVF